MARCEELIAAMDVSGKTIEEVAELSGVSDSTLYRWRKAGVRRANWREIEQVADVLHIDAEDLRDALLRAGRMGKTSAKAYADTAASDLGQPEPTTDTAAVTPSLHGPSPSLSPLLVPHWSNMLRVISRTMNLVGPGELHQVVRDELYLIEAHRAQAPQELRAGFLAVEAQWSEFASWTADCLGQKREALAWLERSIALATAANDKSLIAYSLMRRSQQAVECGDSDGAVTFARKAVATTGITERDRALCRVREAQARALAGDGKGFRKAIDAAYRTAEKADMLDVDDDPRTVGRHCTMTYVAAHEGLGRLHLDDAAGAVGTIGDALRGWPEAYRQDAGLARTWLALALADTRKIEEAAAAGMEALQIGTTSGSVRIMSSLGRLAARVSKSQSEAEIVAKFRTAYDAASRYRP